MQSHEKLHAHPIAACPNNQITGKAKTQQNKQKETEQSKQKKGTKEISKIDRRENGNTDLSSSRGPAQQK